MTFSSLNHFHTLFLTALVVFFTVTKSQYIGTGVLICCKQKLY